MILPSPYPRGNCPNKGFGGDVYISLETPIKLLNVVPIPYAAVLPKSNISFIMLPPFSFLEFFL